MRPIKFRAKALDELYGLVEFGLNEIGNWDESCDVFYVTATPDIPCLISTIVQFAGFKDKNGKDLDWWEGDIFARSSDRRIEGVIIFDMGCFWLDRKRGGRTPLYECVDWSMCKVGDIHTKPELMEQDK